MKTVALCFLLFLSMAAVTTAQTTLKKLSAKEQTEFKSNQNKKQTGQGINNKGVPNITYTLSDTSTNAAFANRQSVGRLQIADPIIQTLNAKANGAEINISGSGMIGVPKGTYGFANGRISFYQVGSTSTGTITGNGSVGTGSSPGGIGTLGPVIGVNGKSPFTGTGPYGTRIPLMPEMITDSSIRRRY